MGLPTTGGSVDNSDPDAPKTIESEVITDFSYTYAGNINMDPSIRIYDSADFSFSSDGENVSVSVSGYLEEQKIEFAYTTDVSFMQSLNAILVKYDVAKDNGLDYHTIGISEEFASTLNVLYDSGEKIHAADNGGSVLEYEVIEEICKLAELHRIYAGCAAAPVSIYYSQNFCVAQDCFNYHIYNSDLLHLMNVRAYIGADYYDIEQIILSDEEYESILELIPKNLEVYHADDDDADEQALDAATYDFILTYYFGTEMRFDTAGADLVPLRAALNEIVLSDHETRFDASDFTGVLLEHRDFADPENADAVRYYLWKEPSGRLRGTRRNEQGRIGGPEAADETAYGILKDYLWSGALNNCPAYADGAEYYLMLELADGSMSEYAPSAELAEEIASYMEKCYE